MVNRNKTTNVPDIPNLINKVGLLSYHDTYYVKEATGNKNGLNGKRVGNFKGDIYFFPVLKSYFIYWSYK